MVRNFRYLAVVSALAAASPALAEDGDWAGPYVIVSAGGSSDRLEVSGSDPFINVSGLFVAGRGIIIVPGTITPFDNSDRKTTFVGGGAVGWLGQSSNFVYGLEAGVHAGKSDVTTSQSVQMPITALTPSSTQLVQRSAKMNYDWDLRVRLGYAANNTLFFASGGVVGARVRMTGTDTYTDPGGAAAPCAGPGCPANFGPLGPVAATASTTQNFVGWTAGAGIEQRIGENVSIGLDYRHNAYGTKNIAMPASTLVNSGQSITDANGTRVSIAGATPGPTRASLTSDNLAVTLSFHF